MNPLYCTSHCFVSTVQRLLTKSLRHLFFPRKKLPRGVGASALAHLHRPRGGEESGPSSPAQSPFAGQRLGDNVVPPPLAIPPLQPSAMRGKQTDMLKNHKNRPTSPKKVLKLFLLTCVQKNTFIFFPLLLINGNISFAKNLLTDERLLVV